MITATFDVNGEVIARITAVRGSKVHELGWYVYHYKVYGRKGKVIQDGTVVHAHFEVFVPLYNEILEDAWPALQAEWDEVRADVTNHKEQP
jgi:hypothetical protein